METKYEDFKALFALHPELEDELRVVILERLLRESSIEILRLTDLCEALQEPALDADPGPEHRPEPPE